MRVEIIDLTTEDGLELNAILYPAAEGAEPSVALDALVLVHGLSGSVFSSLIRYYGEQLAQAGYDCLALNTRGHDIISRCRPSEALFGAAFELVADCLLDLRAALDWLEEQGKVRLGLLGHSLGAVKSLYYGAHGDDARLRAVIAISPPGLGQARLERAEQGEGFRATLAQAQRLVEEGRGQEIIYAQGPVLVPFQAASFLEKFGPEDRYYAANWIERVTVPVLFLAGSEEQWIASFTEELAGMHPLPASSFVLIQGADHSYADHLPEALETTLDWLRALED